MTKNKRRQWGRMVIGSSLLALLLSLLLLSVSGCKTEQWALKSQAIIHQKYPLLEAQNCAARFPIRIDSVAGPTIFINHTTPGPTQYINCDSLNELNEAAKAAGKAPPVNTKAVGNQCPPSTHDTILQPTYITKENTAALTAEQLAHKETTKQLQEKTGSLKTWKSMTAIASGLALLLGVGLFITIRRKLSII